MELGKRIKVFRQNKGISREDLAEHLGISKFAIAKYEQGQREPSIDALKEIAYKLNIPISSLLENKDNFSKDLLSKVQQACQNNTNHSPNEEEIINILLIDCMISNEKSEKVVYENENFDNDEIETIISYIKKRDIKTYNDFFQDEEVKKSKLLGEKIATQRLRNNFSISELSKLSGLEISYIKRLEKGFTSYSYASSHEILSKLSTPLGVSTSYLLVSDKEIENINNPDYVRMPVIDNDSNLFKQDLNKYLNNYYLLDSEQSNKLTNEIIDYIELRINQIK